MIYSSSLSNASQLHISMFSVCFVSLFNFKRLLYTLRPVYWDVQSFQTLSQKIMHILIFGFEAKARDSVAMLFI